MGDDPVTDTGDSPHLTMGAVFHRLCPYYLSIGMSYDMYWNGDVSAAVDYRKAEEYRIKRRNEEMWMQGLYVYNAICSVSPVLHAFAKSGTKPQPYMSEPFPITREQETKKQQSKQAMGDAKAKAFMEMFMIANNKKFVEGGNKDAGNN